MTNEVSPLQMYQHFMAHGLPSLQLSAVASRYALLRELQSQANAVVRCGNKVFSQNDEDGITFEILRRLGVRKGVFGEYGVGDGTENNTLALVAAGWSGFWVGGQDMAFDTNPLESASPTFIFTKAWVKRSNVVELCRESLQTIGKTECDLMSMDLDGNDYHFVEALLAAAMRPKVFIVEYNAKFVPPIHFLIDYSDDHRWNSDDYMGASLTAFHDLFVANGYFLVGCNLTGSNAFFVRKDFSDAFADLPQDIYSLYSPARYFLTRMYEAGLPTSMATLRQIFAAQNAVR
jgi:hypothetical protein